MGAWGRGSFDNDDALDWLAELEQGGAGAAREAIAEVLRMDGDYLEAPTACRAIAAAEVIAALAGCPGETLPPALTGWLARQQRSRDADLLRDAATAVQQVLSGSELRDLWSDSDEFGPWETGVSALYGRLVSALGHAPGD